MASFHLNLLRSLILSLFFHVNSSEYKQWQPNTNWNNPNNWQTGKVPCSRQDVQLISLQPLVVAVSGQVSLHSLSLPTNGELIMNNDAELVFHNDQEKPSDQCPGTGNIKFTATSPENWFNPVNWKEVDSNGNPVVYQSYGLLHLNQIPCVHDQVIFKEKTSFLVKSDETITVASVFMNGQVYEQRSFQDYLDTSTGKIEFNFNKNMIKLTGETCSDPKGCYCSTLQVNKTVCSFVKCEPTHCKTSLSPDDSCCKYCGAILKVQPLSKFKLKDFKNQVNNLSKKFLQSRPPQVKFSISRTKDGLVQLVVTDSGNGKKAQNFAEKVIDQLSGSSQLTIKEKLLSSTDTPTDTPDSGAQKGSSSSVPLVVGAGVGLTVLVVIVIIAAIVFRRKRAQRTRNTEATTSQYEQIEMKGSNGSTDQLSGSNGSTGQLSGSNGSTEMLPGNEQGVHDNDQTQEATNVLYESTDIKQTFDNPLYDSTVELTERMV